MTDATLEIISEYYFTFIASIFALQFASFLVFWVWTSCSAAKAYVTDNDFWRLGKKQDWFLYNICLYRLIYVDPSDFWMNDLVCGYNSIKKSNDYWGIMRYSVCLWFVEFLLLGVLSFILGILLVFFCGIFPYSLYLLLILLAIAFTIGAVYFSLRLTRFCFRLHKALAKSGKTIKP